MLRPSCSNLSGILTTAVDANPNKSEVMIAAALRKFHQEQQGVAPLILEANILGDMVIVRSSGVYTPSEQELAQSSEGKKLIQSARRDLRALTRRKAESEVSNVVGMPILRSFFDIDTRTGDQVEVYILERQIDP